MLPQLLQRQKLNFGSCECWVHVFNYRYWFATFKVVAAVWVPQGSSTFWIVAVELMVLNYSYWCATFTLCLVIGVAAACSAASVQIFELLLLSWCLWITSIELLLDSCCCCWSGRSYFSGSSSSFELLLLSGCCIYCTSTFKLLLLIELSQLIQRHLMNFLNCCWWVDAFVLPLLYSIR